MSEINSRGGYIKLKIKSFSKIGKLSTAVKQVIDRYQFVGLDDGCNPVYDRGVILPSIKLFGTVKLHGTNAAIQQIPDGSLRYQSRTRYITTESDNHGFAFWASTKGNELTEIIEHYRNVFNISDDSILTIYGEWAGKGIQKNVAISEHEKSFYIFAIKESSEEGDVYLNMSSVEHKDSPSNGIYNLWDKSKFPIYEVLLDLNNPKLIQNDLIKITDSVEEECPVAKYLGYSGIGEGVVWVNDNSEFRVKIKGDKHAGKSKVQKTNIVDLEKLSSVNDFVERFVDLERLEQGFNMMIELGYINEPKTTGTFIRWLINDIISEEFDALQVSGIEPKDVNSSISRVASKWYLDKLSNL